MALDKYVAPVFLTDQAKNLNDRFYLLLTNLVNSYPDSKLNPSLMSETDPSRTNIQVYNSNMADMMALQNEYFMYKNSIIKSSQELMAKVNSVDDQINVLDAENRQLSIELDELASSSHSSEGLLDDSQITRNQMLYGNIVLFVIIAAGGFIYYKKVTNK
jgi:hypothetical protein